MSGNKQPERRTFLQDRLEILIKRQKEGKANFNELTELDSIVNSDPEIRRRIIMENLMMEDPGDFTDSSNDLSPEDKTVMQTATSVSLLNRIKSFLSRIFMAPVSDLSKRLLANRMAFI